MSDLTVIIQGCPSQETVDFHLEHYQNYQVIYSIWDWDTTSIPTSSKVKVIRSSSLQDTGSHNFALQVYSTARALEQTETPYAIKLRADEYYSNIDYIFESMVRDPSRLHVLPIFFRPWHLFPFHISDHLIAGTTDNLKAMFESCDQEIKKSNWQWLNSTTPEIGLTEMYLKERTGQDITGRRELMPKHFNILDLTQLEPYLVSVNLMKAKFYSNFCPNFDDSITTLDNY